MLNPKRLPKFPARLSVVLGVQRSAVEITPHPFTIDYTTTMIPRKRTGESPREQLKAFLLDDGPVVPAIEDHYSDELVALLFGTTDAFHQRVSALPTSLRHKRLAHWFFEVCGGIPTLFAWNDVQSDLFNRVLILSQMAAVSVVMGYGERSTFFAFEKSLVSLNSVPEKFLLVLSNLIEVSEIKSLQHPVLSILVNHIRRHNQQQDEALVLKLCDRAAALVDCNLAVALYRSVHVPPTPLCLPYPPLAECFHSIIKGLQHGTNEEFLAPKNFTLVFGPSASSNADAAPPLPEDNIIKVHDWVLSRSWKYFERLTKSNLAEVADRTLDLSSMLSVSSGRHIVSVCYGDLSSLRSIAAVEAHELLTAAVELQLVKCEADATPFLHFEPLIEACRQCLFPAQGPRDHYALFKLATSYGIPSEVEKRLHNIADKCQVFDGSFVKSFSLENLSDDEILQFFRVCFTHHRTRVAS